MSAFPLRQSKKRNDTWVVPYKANKPHLPILNAAPAERSNGGTPEAPLQIPRRASSGRALKARNFTAKGNRTAARKQTCTAYTVALCGEVLGFLGASPKEAPKRGSGRRPEVFPKPSAPRKTFWFFADCNIAFTFLRYNRVNISRKTRAVPGASAAQLY